MDVPNETNTRDMRVCMSVCLSIRFSWCLTHTHTHTLAHTHTHSLTHTHSHTHTPTLTLTLTHTHTHKDTDRYTPGWYSNPHPGTPKSESVSFHLQREAQSRV